MNVAVIGAGLMGSGIAQSCAQAEHTVVIIDVSEEAITKAKNSLQNIIEKRIKKGKMTEKGGREILERVSFATDYSLLSQACVVIEAVPEKIELKKSVFAEIDKYVDDKTILLSNTSGFSISEIASAVKNPNRVIGAHFFYPAPIMRLVELIRGLSTDNQTYEATKEFIRGLGKEIVDAPEYPGFIVNRILVPMQNEAAYLVMEGCKPEDVDKAMKLGTNHPMGPLELTDFVGADVMLATMRGLYEGFHDSKYRPCPLLERMVRAGHLGRKSGQGFYKYE